MRELSKVSIVRKTDSWCETMTKLTITEVSKRWGVSRPTLYRMKSQGKLSIEKVKGRAVVDLSEALRVLGQSGVQSVQTEKVETVRETTTPDNPLKDKVESLQREIELLKESLDHARGAEDQLRGIVDRQTRLLEDKTQRPDEGGLLRRLFGR